MSALKKMMATILFLAGYHSFAQTITAVNKLDSSYQTCLDSGAKMLGCAQVYYKQMDSMLNVVYDQKMLAITDSSKKLQLTTAETAWLTKRDNYFEQINSGGTQDGGLTGDDRLMNIKDKEAAFVKSRVIELLKK